jgi:Cdc6-like AAA superfamily ATPase
LKTTTVNDCVSIVSRECQSSSGIAPIILSINGANVHSSSSLLSGIADVLDETDVSKIGHRLKKLDCPLILVLDEIDLVIRQLFSSKCDLDINSIFSWASEPDYKFILIGISNAVGSKDAKKIMEKVGDSCCYSNSSLFRNVYQYLH